jgi:predicted permease
MVLLVGAGLLVATFLRLASSDPGYDASDVVALSFPGLSQRIQGLDALLSIESTALAAVRDLPGMAGAGWSSSLPLERGLNLPVGPDDRPDEVIGGTEWRAVSPGYLDAMDLVLVAGRDLAVEDVMGGEPVTLVNEAFAEAFFASGAVGERIAIGRYRGRFISPTFEAPPSRIVGIVQDQRDISLRAEARPTVYVPRAQMLPALASPGQLIVEGPWGRAAIDQVIATLAREIPELPAPEIKPLAGVVAASLGSERFHATLLGAFAMLALALTSMGIVGVVSYDVRKRRREIGIRLALGEGAGRVVRQVAGQGMRPIAIGLVVGAGASLYLARTLEALLWGVEPTDPATLVAVAALLAGVSLVAAWLPARGAARANPVEALRSE